MTENFFSLDSLKPIVSLCKRRGFVFPGSAIYGGFANTYSFGPYGVELARNIKQAWWQTFVSSRSDMVGLDGPILLHPSTWEASGHLKGFNDVLIDCKNCKNRFRVDHLLEKKLKQEVEGLSIEELDKLVESSQLDCPSCGKRDWTKARHFNLMFSTAMQKAENGRGDDRAFLRPETAQAIFLDFRHVVDAMRVRLPFGVAQIGKAFRNEITPGNFLFRVIEFEQMEIEYFLKEEFWEETFVSWLEDMQKFAHKIGLNERKISLFEHPKEKLSHYSKRTTDFMYQFPFGVSELWGLAYRTNFDLTQHEHFSNTSLRYTDPQTQEKILPHVIEPTFGVERTFLALLCDAYEEEKLENGDIRTVLRLKPSMAPVKVAVFPLMKKDGLDVKAKSIHSALAKYLPVEYDEGGNIGKRYRRQDEIGTPYCITVDYQTMEDNTVTVRLRDSMEQRRMSVSAVFALLEENFLPRLTSALF